MLWICSIHNWTEIQCLFSLFRSPCVSISFELWALSTHFWDALHFVKFSNVRIAMLKWNEIKCAFLFTYFRCNACNHIWCKTESRFQSGFWNSFNMLNSFWYWIFKLWYLLLFDCCSTYKPVANKLNVNSIKYVRYLVKTTHQISKGIRFTEESLLGEYLRKCYRTKNKSCTLRATCLLFRFEAFSSYD